MKFSPALISAVKEDCRTCKKAVGSDYMDKRDAVLAQLQGLERNAMNTKPPQFRYVELARRAANECTARCMRDKPHVADLLDAQG